MNNKEVFSVHLFLQTLKQLKFIGILGTLVMGIIMWVPILRRLSFEEKIVRQTIYTASFYPVALTFVIITPLLVFAAWNFLNKRNSSDFYHSLPYKRECLFLSRTAAVMAWQIIVHVVVFLGMKILILLNSARFIVNESEMLKVFCVILICNFLCGAAVTLACCLTGNLVSSICVSGLIIFLPRVLTFFYSSGVVAGQYAFMLLDVNHVLSFVDNSHNILFGFVLADILDIDRYSMLSSTVSMIYTVVLTLLYTIAGFVFFKLRKSETAEKATNSRILQMVISALVGFAISALGVVIWLHDKDLFNLIIMLFIAAVVTIVYELIVGKKNGLIKRSLYAVFASYILAAVFALLINIGGHAALKYSPDADQISYIRLNYKNGARYENSYLDSVISQIKIDDAEVKQMVVNTLKSNVDMIKNDEHCVEKFYSGKMARMNIYIKDGLVGEYRTVYTDEKDAARMMKTIRDDEDYVKACKDIPLPKDTMILWGNAYEMDTNTSRELYSTYREEFRSMDINQIEQLRQSQNSIDYIMLKYERKGVRYTEYLPITSDTPKTVNQYIQYINSITRQNDKGTFDKMKDALNEFAQKGTLNLKDKEDVLNISLVGGGIGESYFQYFSIGDEKIGVTENMEEKKKLAAKLYDEMSAKDHHENYNLNKIVIRIEYYANDTYDNIQYYVQLPDYPDSESFGIGQ